MGVIRKTVHVYLVILGTLAVWRTTHLLSQENGPGKVLARLRNSSVDGFRGRLLGCFYCLSLWIAAPFALWLAMREHSEIRAEYATLALWLIFAVLMIYLAIASLYFV